MLYGDEKSIDLNTLQARLITQLFVLVEEGRVNLAQEQQSSSNYSLCVILIKLQRLSPRSQRLSSALLPQPEPNLPHAAFICTSLISCTKLVKRV